MGGDAMLFYLGASILDGEMVTTQQPRMGTLENKKAMNDKFRESSRYFQRR